MIKDVSRYRILYLPIKQRWLDMILSGEKQVEYRVLTPYWGIRLYNRDYDLICFHQYREERFYFEFGGMHIGSGKDEWGAKKGKEYFCIRIGKRLA